LISEVCEGVVGKRKGRKKEDVLRAVVNEVKCFPSTQRVRF
jgi:hypothetical protein